MANYSLSNFLDLPSPTDVKLRIREKDGKLKYTIDPDVAYFFTRSNVVVIKKKDQSSDIILDFSTADIAARALSKINQAKKDIMNNVVPPAPSSGWTIYNEPTPVDNQGEVVPVEIPSTSVVSSSPNYSVINFLDLPSSTDRTLRIREKTGKLRYTVDPYVAYFFSKFNYITIHVEDANNIILDFSSPAEAIEALSKLNEYKKIITSGGSSPTPSTDYTVFSKSNLNMQALVTVNDGDLAVSTSINDIPKTYSQVRVFINGLEVNCGGKSYPFDCYFSADNGVTSRTMGEERKGDKLYWNQSVAGYNLATIDLVDFVYLITMS